MRKLTIFISAIMAFIACDSEEIYLAEGSFEARDLIISSETSGKIVKLNVEEGEIIEQGVFLGCIDTVYLNLQREQLKLQQKAILASSPDVQLQVSAMRENLAKLESEKSRIMNLLNDGAATTKQLDDINSQINVTQKQLKASLSTISNNLESINSNAAVIENQIEQVELKINQSKIVSPITGTVLAKYVEESEFVGLGRPMLKLADLNKVYLRAYLTSVQLADICLGQKLKVVADFGGESQMEYDGVVQWISQESEFTPKNIQTNDSRANLVYAVKIAVENDGRIKIGTHGKVKL